MLAKGQPKLIALDALLNASSRNPSSDSLLAKAMSKVPNFILATRLEGYDEKRQIFTEELLPAPVFRTVAQLSYANIISEGEDNLITCRSFAPFSALHNSQNQVLLKESITSKIASIAWPKAYEKLKERNKTAELINFTNSEQSWFVIDVEQALSGQFNISLKDKVILMGYLGGYIGSPSWEDKFYTPLNPIYAGKASPDMFGLVIHANCLKMIKEANYLNQMPQWLAIILSTLLLMLILRVFWKVQFHYGHLYDIITKLSQLFLAIIIVYLMVIIFHLTGYKIDILLLLTGILLSSDALEIYLGLLKLRQSAIRRFFKKNKVSTSS
ncbi:MAG: hypothetical protein DDT42_02029 [candidate division WS2 bacterium]|uniref:CHASE2 domain-containing protein n=1 Tax=Psychracetigena formicireducens TaxID=2986056 RepID=A0A9E2BIG3_PSYF1|nr:hypothetical protein [Candidatus Psychracetigena formicireducens]